MRNIRLSADAKLVAQARPVARQRHATLDAASRERLRQYADRNQVARNYEALMDRLSYLRPGRKFAREEMNGR